MASETAFDLDVSANGLQPTQVDLAFWDLDKELRRFIHKGA